MRGEEIIKEIETKPACIVNVVCGVYLEVGIVVAHYKTLQDQMSLL